MVTIVAGLYSLFVGIQALRAFAAYSNAVSALRHSRAEFIKHAAWATSATKSAKLCMWFGIPMGVAAASLIGLIDKWSLATACSAAVLTVVWTGCYWVVYISAKRSEKLKAI